MQMKTKIIWGIVIIICSFIGILALIKLAGLVALLLGIIGGKTQGQAYNVGRILGNILGSLTIYALIIYGLTRLGKYLSKKVDVNNR